MNISKTVLFIQSIAFIDPYHSSSTLAQSLIAPGSEPKIEANTLVCNIDSSDIANPELFDNQRNAEPRIPYTVSRAGERMTPAEMEGTNTQPTALALSNAPVRTHLTLQDLARVLE
jgi:hypothetical protein